MAKDDMEIVSALQTALAERMGKERYELWFGAGTRLELGDGTLTIRVPNRFFEEWLRSKFRQQIETACLETLGRSLALEFAVDRQPAVPGARREPASDRSSIPSAKLPADAAATPAASEQGTNDRMQQMPRRRFADLASFVEGESNRLARAAAEMVAAQPGQISPLVIHGPTSVGKTHLLEGVWSATRKRHHGLTAVYLCAEQFTTGFLEALRGCGLPSFRRKYRGVDLLIIDDVQFFCNKRATQTEFLYTVDTLLRERRQLVFACDRAPSEIADLSPELITRLESGMVCRIEPPDYETRLGIVHQMSRRLGICLPAEVAQFVASRLTSHARELSGALCRLHATSVALHQPITLPMAEEALADVVRQGNRAVRLPDIEKAVCEAFGLEPDALKSGCKAKHVSAPRMLAMWLARKYTRAALTEIGHYFGRRSHSTVVSAQKRVDSWLADGASLHLADHTWNADDAIRRVERQLKVG